MNSMKFKVVGIVNDDGDKREVCYADDFENYTAAYDYASYLDDPKNWNSDPQKQPIHVYVREY